MKRQKVQRESSIKLDGTGKNIELQEYDDNNSIPINNFKINEHVLEATVQKEDTLQAIALRFNCTVAELKRLNKIEKEYEIHARKTIKVPITPHTLLLEHIPSIPPTPITSPISITPSSSDHRLDITALKQDDIGQSSSKTTNITVAEQTINDIILNTEILRNNFVDKDEFNVKDVIANCSEREQLLNELEQATSSQNLVTGLKRCSSFSKNKNDALSCSGSDCDISWICLLICILALCFAIPLIYVFYIAEHLNEYHHDADTGEYMIKNHSS